MKKYFELLKLARKSIESALCGKELIVDEKIKKKYSNNLACFVTLTIKGELRGCIGSLEAYRELWEDVISNAKSAAFEDPRFESLSKKEFNKIHIEISVLSKPEKLGIGKEVFEKIDQGNLGNLLKSGDRFSRKAFLPSLASSDK